MPEHILNDRRGRIEIAIFLVEGRAVLPKQMQNLRVVEATGPRHAGMACVKVAMDVRNTISDAWCDGYLL